MNIVVLDGYTLNPGDLSWEGLAKQGNLTVHSRTTAGELMGRAAEGEILLTNKVPLSAETLAGLPKLKFISVLATGGLMWWMWRRQGNAWRDSGVECAGVQFGLRGSSWSLRLLLGCVITRGRTARRFMRGNGQNANGVSEQDTPLVEIVRQDDGDRRVRAGSASAWGRLPRHLE